MAFTKETSGPGSGGSGGPGSGGSNGGNGGTPPPAATYTIERRSVFQPAGEAGDWVKSWNPPTASPPTPERLDPTNLPLGVRANPVPELMHAFKFQKKPSTPHTVERDLLHARKMPTW